MTVAEISIEELLKRVKAWQTGHFLLASGLHSSDYMQCQRVLQYPRYGMQLAEALVAKMHNDGLRPQVVVGPALGAVHWEVFVAGVLDRTNGGEPVRAIFAERHDGGNQFAIRRGIELGAGDRVLVVEDVTTTGGSAQQVVDLVRESGAIPIAVGAILDRSGGKARFDVPFYCLLNLNLPVYDPSDCPLCQKGQPLVKPGSKRQS